ncbi:hypothetical protein [Streptomyces sp. Root1310]|uniref:hypothetical protein n=1 Tax=Streptomyces sp. Root1310 TaxID=1736452 RepID=UPI0007091F2B|nr:hypothetical protein [Streptomyces sp. Root1310]KQX78475.1 hypothetical protein ASD48_34700 [Streptomyces sp. Root1310]
MIDSTTSHHSHRGGHATAAPAPADVRADRRRLIEAIRALRRLLDKRRPFELTDRRRLNHEARKRSRAEATHGKSLHRIAERQTRQERSLARRLNGLDGRRDHQERQALAVLRRESVERTLRGSRLTASDVNGIGSGLVRALAAQGITTAADFTRVSWGRAPNGKGGEVLYIHRAQGRKVHINGIGEHRGRPLMEWRRAALARAEARAPRELPPDERHRIAEIIEAERTRLQGELAQAPGTAEAARAEAVQLHTEVLGRLTAAEREAARRAAERRAEFDTMAEQLLTLQAELTAHMDRHGDAGRRIRRAQTRALRPLPENAPVPAAPIPAVIPAPRTPLTLTKTESGAGTKGQAQARTRAEAPPPVATPTPSPGTRASLGWLLPILYFGFTTLVGVGELGDNTAPLGLMICSRLFAFAATAELLRLWVPRRSWRTPSPMPSGTGPQAFGVFLALTAAGMFADEKSDVFLIACVTSVLAAALLVTGARLRWKEREGAAGGTTTPFG